MISLYKFWVILLCVAMFPLILHSQNVGIGTNAPHSSAKLHIADNNRGILIPQISIGNIALPAPVTTPATGLLVWNTNAAIVGGGGQGFYYWNGTQWTMLSTSSGTDNQNLTSAVLSGNTLTINIEDGASTSVNLSSLINDADFVVGNEYNTGISLTGTTLNVTDGGGNQSIDLAPLRRGAENGLHVNAGNNRIRLGGNLIQTTTITQGAHTMRFDLTGTGEFHIRNAGLNHFSIFNSGDAAFGSDMYWRDGSTGGTLLGRFYDNGNDGVFEVHSDGVPQHRINSVGTTVFNERSMNVDFRIESDANPNMFYINASTNRIGFGTNAPSHTLHIIGTERVSSLAGTGNRMVIANSNGVLGTQAIPLGDITAVIAGIGLTGGGTNGNVTVNAAANNGLHVDATADRIQLGGPLTETTTITNGSNDMILNLNNLGNFYVQDNSVNKFLVHNNGNTYFGGNTYWREGNTNSGTSLGRFYNSGNDGIFSIYHDGTPQHTLNSVGTTVFNEKSLNVDFRIESDANQNMFFMDASTNRVSVGTSATAGTFNVQGNSYHSDDIFLRDGAVNSGDVLVRIHDSADDGILDIYENNGINHRIHGNGTTVFNEQGNNNADLRIESDANQNMFFMDASANRIGLGTNGPSHTLHVVGTGRVSSLAGTGNRMVTADANGVLGTQAIPIGDITAVTAGAGLTGGGTNGNVTVNAAANNGLHVDAAADRIQLGGALVENTTIRNGANALTINLDNSGDFHIQDGGVNHLSVFDNGNTQFGGDVLWRDENTSGTALASLVDDGNDGRFRIMENGATSVDLDANSQFIFNEQGFDRNFRIESDANQNMFFMDAGTNRVSIGTSAATGTFNVQGNSYHSDDIFLRDGAVNGGDILVRIHDSSDDGILDIYENNGINHRIHGNGTTVFNEQGNDNADVRMESDTRTNAFWLDANENLVRFGTASTGSDSQNGTVIGGTTVDYVADFDRGSSTGTAIGIGSIEYLLDNSSETSINNSFSPTTHINRDLGFSTTTRGWDDVYADNFVNISDAREKEDIKELQYGLKEVLQMRPVSYILKRDPFGDRKLGLIAQEALVLVPEAVKTHDHKVLDESKPEEYSKIALERMGMTYQQLIPVLIKATQEQQAQIEMLKKEIEHLKAK